MRIIRDNFSMKIEEEIFVALGSFDGLHIGHRALIEAACSLARENSASSMVSTFENHPLTVISPDIIPQLLMDEDEKLDLLKSMGVDIVNLMKFSHEFMEIEPEDFICKLVKHYNVKGIVVGYNYRFGHKNKGDLKLLNSMSNILGYRLKVIDPVYCNNEIVSSTTIRNLIKAGDIEKANLMLNRPYYLYGTVVRGRNIGHKIGFPTINLQIPEYRVIPKVGVYYTHVLIDGCIYKGITSVGYNPTVQGNKLTVETHVLNFDKEIYGESVRTYFISYMRDEIKFGSLDELKKQLASDKNDAYIKDMISL